MPAELPQEKPANQQQASDHLDAEENSDDGEEEKEEANEEQSDDDEVTVRDSGKVVIIKPSLDDPSNEVSSSSITLGLVLTSMRWYRR
mgnify:CR=1 FL=1